METSFVIDLRNPKDLVAKYGDAVAILEAKKQELASLRDLERDVAKWQSVVDFLASQIPDGIEGTPDESHLDIPETPNGRNGSSAPRPMDLVVEVVNREIRKIRAKEVRDILASEGHDLTPEQVSNALHYAAHGAKKIADAPGRGMYAPLAYKETELPDPTATLGATGPAQAQPTDAAAT